MDPVAFPGLGGIRLEAVLRHRRPADGTGGPRPDRPGAACRCRGPRRRGSSVARWAC